MSVRVHNLCIFALICISIRHVAGTTTTSTPSPPRYVAKPISIRRVPYMASLHECPRGACLASVIHKRFLLTAASSLVLDWKGNLANLTKARVGSKYLDKGGQLYAIEKLIPHEKYLTFVGDYNIGLVKLAKKIDFGSTVGQIKLGKKVIIGDLVDIIGWGVGENLQNSTKGAVHEVSSLPVLVPRRCQGALLGRIIHPRNMCVEIAGVPPGDFVCDEGGPVVVNNSIVGVGSTFWGCGLLPGVYTRVSRVKRWIRQAIDNNTYIEF
ncbi:trypsin 3A1-like [Ostrinia nubilalis]|uniref:trypsin 3A1-like n=1 Tax=Ostrinia nubilalis TaxID=29057 RepID=UPI0030825FE1